MTLSDRAKQLLPKHVAVIMDGNGRWAKQRNLHRVEGHKHGVDSVRTIVRLCGELGISYLTLYAFSMENWARPSDEVTTLMEYLAFFLIQETPDLLKKNVRIQAIGRLELLPEAAQEQLKKSIEATSHCTGLTLVLALSYGSREEILRAVKEIAQNVKDGKIEIQDISEQSFSNALYTSGMPDPDLLIRTSGEMRLSNFLLWQLSYSELYVTKTLWPDFGEAELFEALENYAQRNRRFGKTEG